MCTRMRVHWTHMLHAVAFECISILFVLLICTKMELPTHPLLCLVESNKKRLKSMLKSYIDDTVDNQFSFLKNSILKMIQSDQIGPHVDVTAFGTTLPPPTQANSDQWCLNCNNQMNITQDHQNTLQNEVSQANTINTDEQMIKQEFDEEDEENEDGEEIDEDNVMHCENYEKGICNSVRENYDNTIDCTNMGESGNDPLEIQHNINVTLEKYQSIISNDILPSTTNPINSEPLIKQQCSQGSSITIPLDFNTNANAQNDISIDEPIEGQNPHIQTDEFDANDDVDDDDYESDQNEYLTNSNCANGVCDLDHANNNNHLNDDVSIGDGDETDIDHNLDDDEQLQNDINTSNNNQINNQNDEENVIDERSVSERNIEQSTPSTSGVRSSARKRIPKKVVGDLVQSNVNSSNRAKRKNDQSNESVKKGKRENIMDNSDDDSEGDNNDDQEEVKGQIIVLKLNCTESGCRKTVTSRALWREHMRHDHHKRPHHQLKSNVRLNDRDQAEHRCIKPTCNLICTTHKSLIHHWSRYHHPGKYKCSLCPVVGNLFFKVQNHFDTTHGSHLCTHCGKKCNRMSELKRHERIHTGERPYKCTWEKCQLSFKRSTHAVQHVRLIHFHLPKSTKEQNELNIIDSRNAHDYIHKD